MAESYFELGEADKAEALYRDWLKADPGWGWGWIGWSDRYRFTRTKRQDLKRCEEILREGLSIAGVRDRADVAERLADLLEEQGRNEEAAEFWREAEAAAPTSETTLDIRSGGKVLRQNTQVKYGGAGLPLRELPSLAALLRENRVAAPVTRQKIRRNEPCPCGSGKKFKKCCGRGATTAFASAANEQAAATHGVRRVVLPRRGPLSAARRAHQRQRWFRRTMCRRTGSEESISALKRRHGLSRCRYRGVQGMERWVGLGVMANNLLALARAPAAKSGMPRKR